MATNWHRTDWEYKLTVKIRASIASSTCNVTSLLVETESRDKSWLKKHVWMFINFKLRGYAVVLL